MKPSRDTERRTDGFGLQVLRRLREYPRHAAAVAIAGSAVARSGTGAVANTHEARAAHAKRESVQNMTYAQTEVEKHSMCCAGSGMSAS